MRLLHLHLHEGIEEGLIPGRQNAFTECTSLMRTYEEAPMRSVIHAARLMLSSKKHLVIVICSSIFMFFLAVLIPAVTIPSNTVEFQLLSLIHI